MDGRGLRIPAKPFTGDPLPDVDRRSLAVEPMTCPANAFRTGEGLIRLERGDSFTSKWGLCRQRQLDRSHPARRGSAVARCRLASAGSRGRECRRDLSRLSRRIVLPTVVLEILLGILIGPEGLDLAQVDTTSTSSPTSASFLFFFAGLELVEHHVVRRSLVRGTIGWESRLRSESA